MTEPENKEDRDLRSSYQQVGVPEHVIEEYMVAVKKYGVVSSAEFKKALDAGLEALDKDSAFGCC